MLKQLEALVGDGCAKRVESAGALTIAEGMCEGRPLRIAVTDRSISGGSFGIDECEALCRALSRSMRDRVAVVLVLDSAGARLDAGLAGLAAFRKMYRMALDLPLTGVSMTALILGNCFGGASMLAMLCENRAALRTARLGMSGPGIVETFSGKDDLDASDPAQIQALFGAPVRFETGALDHVFEAHASIRDVLSRLLRSASRNPLDPVSVDLTIQHNRLRERLRHAGLAVDVVPEGTLQSSVAFRSGHPVGAHDIWLLADDILNAPAEAAINLDVDCPGQAATRIDEQLVLSEYVVHLALCMRAHCVRGGKIEVRILGESAGGIYVALASAADSVEADAAATVRVLPAVAVRTVLGRSLAEETLDDALATGVVDRLASATGTSLSDNRTG